MSRSDVVIVVGLGAMGSAAAYHLARRGHRVLGLDAFPRGHTPFVIDRRRQHAQVVYAFGFSGHGFKFSCVVGTVLADLAMDGATRHAIGFLATQRFATSREVP